jgi:hypothetical protein
MVPSAPEVSNRSIPDHASDREVVLGGQSFFRAVESVDWVLSMQMAVMVGAAAALDREAVEAADA